MDPKSERGQILFECLFALGFLVIMLTFLQRDWQQKQYKKTIEGQRIYNLKKFKIGNSKYEVY